MAAFQLLFTPRWLDGNELAVSTCSRWFAFGARFPKDTPSYLTLIQPMTVEVWAAIAVSLVALLAFLLLESNLMAAHSRRRDERDPFLLVRADRRHHDQREHPRLAHLAADEEGQAVPRRHVDTHGLSAGDGLPVKPPLVPGQGREGEGNKHFSGKWNNNIAHNNNSSSSKHNDSSSKHNKSRRLGAETTTVAVETTTVAAETATKAHLRPRLSLSFLQDVIDMDVTMYVRRNTITSYLLRTHPDPLVREANEKQLNLHIDDLVHERPDSVDGRAVFDTVPTRHVGKRCD